MIMIEAKELRKGSIVEVDSSWYNDEGEFIEERSIEKVEHVRFGITTVKLDNVNYRSFQDFSRDSQLDDTTPVDLTEEWMNKTDIEWHSRYSVTINGWLNLDQIGDSNHWEYQIGDKTIVINYVHQLQNVLQLAGEELELTPPK